MLSASEFMALGELMSHEELRDGDAARLHHIDLMSELQALGPKRRVAFFSHQWTSFDHPDHTGAQYAVMIAALREVIESNGWSVGATLVWVDYASTPQRNKHTQKLAISSFVSYAASAHAFIAVAPRVTHLDTGAVCDDRTYRKRMWCRAEQLAHFLRNGTDSMWIAAPSSGDGVASLRPMGGDQRHTEATEWEDDFLRVFEGDSKYDTDKADLVQPLLGLYGQLYSEHDAEHAASDSRYARVLQKIKSQRAACFPASMTLRRGGELELFGDLVERLEKLVDGEGVVSEAARKRLRHSTWRSGRWGGRRGSLNGTPAPAQLAKKERAPAVYAYAHPAPPSWVLTPLSSHEQLDRNWRTSQTL
jgi:hypothetical protein